MQAGSDMETLRTRAREFARAVWVVPKVRRLLDRVDQLEREVQETRRLHQRVAELTDVVAEVLVPAADRDDDRIRAVLAKYNQTSF